MNNNTVQWGNTGRFFAGVNMTCDFFWSHPKRRRERRKHDTDHRFGAREKFSNYHRFGAPEIVSGQITSSKLVCVRVPPKLPGGGVKGHHISHLSDPARLFWYQDFSGAAVQIQVFI